MTIIAQTFRSAVLRNGYERLRKLFTKENPNQCYKSECEFVRLFCFHACMVEEILMNYGTELDGILETNINIL